MDNTSAEFGNVLSVQVSDLHTRTATGGMGDVLVTLKDITGERLVIDAYGSERVTELIDALQWTVDQLESTIR